MGNGTLHYANGDKYEGSFQNGQKEGKGKYTHVSGSIYFGNWRGDKKDGQGTIKYPNGDQYEGSFTDGMRHGEGIYVYSDGARYQGMWQNDEKNG